MKSGDTIQFWITPARQETGTIKRVGPGRTLLVEHAGNVIKIRHSQLRKQIKQDKDTVIINEGMAAFKLGISRDRCRFHSAAKRALWQKGWDAANSVDSKSTQHT